jgi:hypothetical protein
MELHNTQELALKVCRSGREFLFVGQKKRGDESARWGLRWDSKTFPTLQLSAVNYGMPDGSSCVTVKEWEVVFTICTSHANAMLSLLFRFG